MNMTRMPKGLYVFSEWVSRLVYLNFLWMFFSVSGLLVVSFFPATLSMFSVARKWMMEGEDIPVFKTFWKNFKSGFIQANMVGYILLIICAFVYADFTMLNLSDAWYIPAAEGALIIFVAAFSIVLLYIFPVLAHYDLKLLAYFKYALLIGISFPGVTLLLFSSIVLWYFVLVSLPALIPLLSMSSLACMVTLFSWRVFIKTENKAEEMSRTKMKNNQQAMKTLSSK